MPKRVQNVLVFYVRTRTLICHIRLSVITYPLLWPLGGTYALNYHVALKDGTWEASRPFAISESFKLEEFSILPFNLLHADVRSAIHSCVAALNGETNNQPHLIKWAFKEAYRIRDNNRYGFIVECLVTKRGVVQHRAQAGKHSISVSYILYLIPNKLFKIIELFNPTPMLLVSVKILPGEYRIQSKLPLSTLSQTSGTTSSWTKVSLQYMSAVGNVTAVINNNDPDLTKHAWGCKGLSWNADHLFVIMEWQHAGLVHIPPPSSVPSANSPTLV